MKKGKKITLVILSIIACLLIGTFSALAFDSVSIASSPAGRNYMQYLSECAKNLVVQGEDE